jgi:hypothetical protein
MFVLKSCSVIKATGDLTGHGDIYHAKYDIEQNNGKTTLSCDLDVFLNMHTGAVLDAKVVIDQLKCENMAALHEKLTSWFSRLSLASSEPVIINNFVPSYSRDYAKKQELKTDSAHTEDDAFDG